METTKDQHNINIHDPIIAGYQDMIWRHFCMNNNLPENMKMHKDVKDKLTKIKDDLENIRDIIHERNETKC